MRRSIGPLGWTAEEHQEYARTGKWPERDAEAPDSPPGLTLTSIPQAPEPAGMSESKPEPEPVSAGELLVFLMLPKRQKPGPKRLWKDVRLLLECQQKTGEEKEADRLFLKDIKPRLSA